MGAGFGFGLDMLVPAKCHVSEKVYLRRTDGTLIVFLTLRLYFVSK